MRFRGFPALLIALVIASAGCATLVVTPALSAGSFALGASIYNDTRPKPPREAKVAAFAVEDPAAAEAEYAACLERRREVFRGAAGVADIHDRTRIYASAAACVRPEKARARARTSWGSSRVSVGNAAAGGFLLGLAIDAIVVVWVLNNWQCGSGCPP